MISKKILRRSFVQMPFAGLLLAALGLALTALVSSSTAFAADEAPPLMIFHTNDVHGYALEVMDDQGRLTHIGYSRMQAYINSCQAQHKMLLDAGDVLHGQPFATARKGEFIAMILSRLGYDALAVGNHDFDYGLPRLMQLKDQYGLNFIAANIIEKEDGAPLLPPYILKDFGDLKVGVFGLSTPATPLSTAPGNVASVVFGAPEDVVAVAQVMADKLRESGAELVVALTHLGADPVDDPSAQDIAGTVTGIDLIIDGHSHSEIAGLMVGQTLIVSTGAFLKNLGQVTVTRDGSGRLTLAPKLIKAAELDSVKPDPVLEALVFDLSAELDKDLSQVVVTLPFALNGEREAVRTRSTNFGRILCAAIKQITRADAAIFNSGGIRSSLKAGAVTKGDLLGALPYGNYVVTVRMKGSELIKALNIGLTQPNGGGFPQFYGLLVTARETKEYGADGTVTRRGQVESAAIDGRSLDLEAYYTVAINDFMYAGGDGYDLFASYPSQTYDLADSILLQYLAQTELDVLDEINRDDVLDIISEEATGAE